LAPVFLLFALAAVSAPAQIRTPVDADDQERRVPETEIVVTGQRLDSARAKIEPSLGASTYTLSNDAIENRPGGETRNLGTILRQVPGVRADGQGRLVVRGAPGGVQFRLNNVILPDGVADFGENLSARLAARTELITGALPAQYGLAAGSVVNIITKNGLYQGGGGQAELYGGSHGTFEPAFEWATAKGATSLFVSGSYRRSNVGLAAPDGRSRPLHDGVSEVEGFGFLDHVIDDDTRVSLILGSSNERNDIPGLTVRGLPGSADRHGEQRTGNHYAIASYQHSAGNLSLQESISGLLSNGRVSPHEAPSITIDGVARSRDDRRATIGTQIEAAYTLSEAHTVRAGLIASADRQHRDERLVTATSASATRANDRRLTASLFVEDEWTIAPSLTANLGLRGDRVSGLGKPVHLGPRASLNWAAAKGINVHGGYARYFIAPPLGEARVGESDDYVDIGVERKSGDLTFGIDAYARASRNMLGERLWRPAPVGDSFAYRRGRSEGVELLATYADGPVTAWANVAFSRTRGRGISVGRELFTPEQLAFVDRQWVKSDLDQAITASGGASRRFGPLLLSAALTYGSGVRRTAAGGSPNGAHLPANITLNLAAVYRLKLIEDHPLDLRVDVLNAGDRRYAYGDGSGLAHGAPMWSSRRGIFVGIEQGF
jgi:outer membrane cobalamin receptor